MESACDRIVESIIREFAVVRPNQQFGYANAKRCDKSVEVATKVLKLRQKLCQESRQKFTVRPLLVKL